MSFFHGSSAALARFEGEKKDAGGQYPCTVMRWVTGTPGHHALHMYDTATAGELGNIKDCPLTVMCAACGGIDACVNELVLTAWSVAPLDEDEVERLAGFRALVDKYDIPGTFINETNQHVVNSFGYIEKSERTTCTWLHFLLKEVEQVHEAAAADGNDSKESITQCLGRLLRDPLGLRRLQKSSPDTDPSKVRIPLRQLDGEQERRAANWSRCAFFLRTEKRSTDPRNTTSGPVSNPMCEEALHNITLICFGAPLHIVDEMERLSDTMRITDVLHQPYILWELILYHLSMYLDVEMWNLTEVFGKEQHDLGYLTGRPSKLLNEIDFSGLHLLADHMILILEGARGLLASVDGLIHHLETDFWTDSPSHLARRTRQALQYRRRFILSTTERGISFEKRITNMISLFFNQVSLQDSGMVMRDSTSLRNIALMTLFFLPVTTAATVFGSEFFYHSEKEDGSRAIHMDPAGWIMFFGSGLTTVVMVSIWGWQVKKLDKRFTRGAARLRQAEFINVPA